MRHPPSRVPSPGLDRPVAQISKVEGGNNLPPKTLQVAYQHLPKIPSLSSAYPESRAADDMR